MLALAFAVLAQPAAAQQNVSGAIVSDTVWRTADGPVQVVGTLTVTNGATLTIEPGVTVALRADVDLVIQQGALRVLGSVQAPVTITSAHDVPGDTPAPGDWGRLRFLDGTLDTSTVVQHARIRYGRGVVFERAGATFNNVLIADHAGAAITADLHTSLAGSGNSALGNTLNGVAVPAGDITDNVKWGLRGIPYFVASGVVSVGASPTVSLIIPDSIQQGDTVSLVVSGTGLAGLSAARFDRPGLTAQILPGSSGTQANLSVSADVSAALGQNALRLLVDAGEVSSANGVQVTRLQPTLASVAPSVLYVGQANVEVALGGRNFLPQSVAEVDGAAVSTQYQSPAQLRATIATPQVPGSLSVRLRTPDPLLPGQDLLSNVLALPVVPAQLTVAPGSAAVAKGFTKTFTVSVPYAVPAGGLTFNLVSSVPGVASVPATLTLLEGQSSVSFQLSAIELGSSVITASKPGFISGQAQVTVVPPPTLTLIPNALSLGVGRSAEVTVQSNVPAGPSGLTVALSSTDGTVVAMPAEVTIPAGASSATFTLTTTAIGTAVLRAQATDFVTGSTALTVRAVSLSLPDGALVAPGLTRSIPIALSDPAPAGGLLVTLSSSNPAVAAVPASLTVPAGASNANFTLTGVAAGTASVSASASGYQAASLPVTVEAVSVRIGDPVVTSISVPVDSAQVYPVTLSRPAPIGGVLVDLSVADSSKAAVTPATVFIPEGQTSGGAVQATLTGVAEGSTTLLASAAGLTTASVPLTVTKKAELVFSASAVKVGKGLKTYIYEVYVYRRTGTANYAPNQALTLSLASSDPGRATVPATLTISADSYYAYFTVTGVELSAGNPVNIDANATSYTSPAVKLAVSVLAPVFNFSELDLARSPASARDDLRISVSVPGATYANNQTAAADLPIDLAIAQATPSGIVDGFYSALTGGAPVTQVLLRKDNTFSDHVYVGTPGAPGSYRVQASSAGVATATSGVVTVSAPELKFSSTAVTVGKGLKSYSFELYVQRTVNGQNLNGAEALSVNLSSSDPTRATVPASVTIPANSYYAYFTVTGVELSAGSPVSIDATAAGYSAPVAKLAVNIVTPVFNFSGLDTTRSPASARDDLRISVSTPGAAYANNQTAAAGMPIDLEIVQASPADVVDGFYDTLTGGAAVNRVLLRKDNTSSDSVYVGTPSAAGSYRVQASSTGIASATSGVVTVVPPELKFSSTAVTVGKGLNTYAYEMYVARTVNGQNFNGAAALTVNLSSSDPTRASVPATVTIAANSYYAYFTVTGVDLTAGGAVSIDASAAGYSAPAVKLAVTVVTPVFNFSGLDTARSPASARDDLRIYVTTPGAAYPNNQTAATDLPIDLAVVQAAPAGIVDGFYSALTGGAAVAQVLLRKDNTYSDFVYVGTPNAAGSYRAQASAAGVATAISAAVTVSPPELKFSSAAITVGKGLKTYLYEISVQRAVNGVVFNGAQAVTVDLACSSTAVCSVPASVTIPAGQSGVNFLVEGVGLGSTTITASATGYSATQDLAVNVVTPQLVFSGPASQIAVGGQSSLRVYVNVAGAAYANNQTAAQPIAVNLTSSAPGVASVPATVTIAASDTYSQSVNLVGVAPGTTTLTASGAGLTSAVTGVITVSP